MGAFEAYSMLRRKKVRQRNGLLYGCNQKIWWGLEGLGREELGGMIKLVFMTSLLRSCLNVAATDARHQYYCNERPNYNCMSVSHK